MRAKVWILLLAVSPAFILCSGPKTGGKKYLLDTYHSSAVAFFESGALDSSLAWLDKCLELDGNYAPAHYLLGKIYLKKDGIYNRRLSALALKEAIKADQDNSEYRYSLGLTLEKQTFYLNALDAFHEAARLDSTDPRPFVGISRINERMGLRYDDDNYFERSLAASARAAVLSDDPAQYYRQAIALYQMGRYDSAGAILALAAAKADSAAIRAQCWLLLGTVQVIEKRFDSANNCYERGREQMTLAARQEMDDTRFLMTADEYKKYLNAGPIGQQSLARLFWGEIDPDPTTGINERRLEHYARLVHAQVTFSLPEKHIDGWRTKRGELYIRYGPPTEQVFSLGNSPGDPPRWTWTYERFETEPTIFYFEDTFLNGDFNFPFPNKSWTAEDYANDPGRLAVALGSAIPQDFVYAPGSGKLEFEFMPKQFKGRGRKTAIEVFVAIPNQQLQFVRDGEIAKTSVIWRQVLRYPNRQLADSAGAIRSYTVRESQTEDPDYSIADRMALAGVPDSMLFSISIRDTLSNRASVATTGLRIRNFHSGKVEISDIVLARRIEQPPGELSFRRDQLAILSNLENRYFAGEPIWLYFEIYGLALGSEDMTSYSIRLSITEKRTRNLLGAFRDVVTGRDLAEVVTTYEGRSVNTDENRILRVDVSEFYEGTYTLTIEIDDQNSGRVAMASEEIVIYR
jgi:GWxTD domain-containing protein